MKRTQPFFSIVVPTHNRRPQLTKCLESLARMDYPRSRFETIVVNDGGDEPLEELITSFESRLDVVLLTQLNAGPATARNVGATRAKGEFLAFTDDDCMPASNWLQNLAFQFNQDSECAVGGHTINGLPQNPYSTASQLLVEYLYNHFKTTHRSSFFTSNNLALPKNLFHSIGGFATSFPLAAGEDREFCGRWTRRGYKLIFSPQALIYHHHSMSLFGFFWQHFNYGRGAVRLREVYRRNSRKPLPQESPSFYLNLLGYPFKCHRLSQGLVLFILLAASQCASFLGIVWQIAKDRHQGHSVSERVD